MALIRLADLKPQEVSQDITSYSMLLYGGVKAGKSTFIQELYGDRVLNIMTEKRFKAMDGGYFQYVGSWSDFQKVLSQLASKDIKERFDVISIDTIDNLFQMLQKHIIEKYDETVMGERNLFGKDWSDLAQSWSENLQRIEQLGYTPVFVSHSITETVQVPVKDFDDSGVLSFKEVKENGVKYAEYERFVPDVKAKYLAPINKMVDNIVFLHNSVDSEGREQRLLELRGTVQYEAGSTFRDIVPTIKLDADIYRNVIKEAVSKATNKTDERRANSDIYNDKSSFEDVKRKAVEAGKLLASKGRKEDLQSVLQDVLGVETKLKDTKPSQQDLVEVVLLKLEELLAE